MIGCGGTGTEMWEHRETVTERRDTAIWCALIEVLSDTSRTPESCADELIEEPLNPTDIRPHSIAES